MFNSFSVYFKVLSDFSVDLYFKEKLGMQFNEMHHFQRVNYARSPRFKNKILKNKNKIKLQ